MTRIAHRPFETETIEAIRNAYHAVDDAFMLAKFSSPLERSAFAHRPKHARDDEGAATEEQWHDAWLQITWFVCSKSVAYEAIGISKKAYEARRRRSREKANGLSINDEEALESLNEMIAHVCSRVRSDFERFPFKVALALDQLRARRASSIGSEKSRPNPATTPKHGLYNRAGERLEISRDQICARRNTVENVIAQRS